MSTALQSRVEAFLASRVFAVVGASADRAKFGNKVLRCYQQAGREVAAVNRAGGTVEGLVAYPDLTTATLELQGAPEAISIVTPPRVTEAVMREAVALGIRHAWMQPGAQSPEAVAIGRAAGMSVIAGDACLLVVLGFREGD